MLVGKAIESDAASWPRWHLSDCLFDRGAMPVKIGHASRPSTWIKGSSKLQRSPSGSTAVSTKLGRLPVGHQLLLILGPTDSIADTPHLTRMQRCDRGMLQFRDGCHRLRQPGDGIKGLRWCT